MTEPFHQARPDSDYGPRAGCLYVLFCIVLFCATLVVMLRVLGHHL